MNRSTQRKVSRALVGGLGAVVALGGVFYLGKVVGSNASNSQAKAERGETTEAVVAAKSTAAAGNTAGAGTGATTKPAHAGALTVNAFSPDLASARVLETPTSPVGSSSSSSSATSTTQPSSSAPLLAAAAGAAGSATTRPTNAVGANGAPASPPPNVQLASLAGTDRPAAAAPAAPPLTGNPLADAKQRLEHGKTLEARKILNAAITERALGGDADLKAAKKMLDEINAVVVFSTKQFKDDEFGGTFEVPSGGVLDKIAKSHDISTELLKRINGISDPKKLRAGQNLKVMRGPFNALVDKSDFALELWIGEPEARGSMYVMTLPVGLGEDDSTPTGTWAVKNRVSNPAYFSPRGEGIIAADDPKNPLGEHWIGLSGTEGNAVGKQSYGIHGTIDPDSIGKQASMGCIRLRNDDVARVFEALVQDKSTVTVRE